ncbi:hypothetical protein OGH69_17365 [Flavobacterium sp. MFBS3-15]|uniref:hypothetical protein n=1 Tax=Flavobacterium sp. MFBS3-15 TaxID=2989816 RepID=UPI0022358912|nr:hypothetical protein [Flavobacterium sp. MFBS3-15]MCW4470745.1 hypothetical protein [Flavobacterium sp. MFBS3-15]
MKKLLTALFLTCAIYTHSQEINYFPYCYEGKWGITDVHKNEVLAPVAKDIDFLEKEKGFVFVKNDNGKNYFFNVTDGSKMETRGELGSRLDIGKETFYLMKTESGGDYLYNFASKKEYPQQLKYKFMYNQKLTDEKGKAYNYVIGYLATGKIVVMDGNSPELKQVLPETFDEVTYVAVDRDDYGIVLKKGKDCLAFTPDLKLKGSFTSDESVFFLDEIPRDKMNELYDMRVFMTGVPELRGIRTESENLIVETMSWSYILNRKEGDTKTPLAKVMRGRDNSYEFTNFKGLELFYVDYQFKAKFAGVIKVIKGKKELMVPAKYTGL